MHYISSYKSPLGNILLAADGIGLTGIWFEGQKHFCAGLEEGTEEKEVPVIKDAKRWLDIYFSGNEPDFDLPIHFVGTDFQKEIWDILCKIPYGKTITYGDIAKTLAERKGLKKMSARAVGNAVGRNKISIIVPCHRVLGANGNLTGYAGGIERKTELLKIEKIL